MADESAKSQSVPPKGPGTATRAPKKIVKRRLLKRANEKSQISFPYMDMEAGISVARAVLDAGGVALTREQLAGVMKLAVGSGNFVTKVATARMFGLVAYVGGKYELSDLGFSIVDTDEKRQKAARAEAFLNVPLYKRAYDEFRGKQLPPRPHGLEQAFVKFGVAAKQRTTARLVFDKSATQAGFFTSGPDRLIEPIIGVVASRGPQGGDIEEPETALAPSRARPQATNDLPHFMHMLIEALPEPGTNWTVDGRAKWLQAAATAFDLSYKGDGTITISAKAEHDESKKE